MNIPADKITPGVWEVRWDGFTGLAHIHSEDGRLCCDVRFTSNLSYSSLPLRVGLEWGWQFTARYVRCEGETFHCDCPMCGNDDLQCRLCKGVGRGLFVPQEPKQ